MSGNKLNAIFLGAAILVGGATSFPYQDKPGAQATLEKTTALKNIQIRNDRIWFSCGKGDVFRTGFTAVNDKGQEVDGVVCRGIFKGSTIRYNN